MAEKKHDDLADALAAMAAGESHGDDPDTQHDQQHIEEQAEQQVEQHDPQPAEAARPSRAEKLPPSLGPFFAESGATRQHRSSSRERHPAGERSRRRARFIARFGADPDGQPIVQPAGKSRSSRPAVFPAAEHARGASVRGTSYAATASQARSAPAAATANRSASPVNPPASVRPEAPNLPDVLENPEPQAAVEYVEEVTVAATEETYASPSPAAAPVRRPPPRRGPTSANKIAQIAVFKQTMIPILLTCGLIMLVMASLRFFVDDESPFAALGLDFSVVFYLFGAALLAFGVFTMLQVKHQLDAAKKLALAEGKPS